MMVRGKKLLKMYSVSQFIVQKLFNNSLLVLKLFGASSFWKCLEEKV